MSTEVLTNQLNCTSGAIGGLTSGAGSIGGYPYAIQPLKQNPYIQVNFRWNSSLEHGLDALKELVKNLEQDIDANFGHQCGSEFRSFSKTENTPFTSVSVSYGA